MGKSKKTRQRTNLQGPPNNSHYTRKCAASTHGPEQEHITLYSITGREPVQGRYLVANQRNALEEKEIIKKGQRFICEVCLQSALPKSKKHKAVTDLKKEVYDNVAKSFHELMDSDIKTLAENKLTFAQRP